MNFHFCWLNMLWMPEGSTHSIINNDTRHAAQSAKQHRQTQTKGLVIGLNIFCSVGQVDFLWTRKAGKLMMIKSP